MTFKERFALVKLQFKQEGLLKSLKKTVIYSHSTPHDIAAGFATGFMFSFFPSFGGGMIISLLIAWKREWNLLSTYLGTLFVNPFTASFWYLFEYRVGEKIIGNGIGLVENITNMNLLPVAKQVFLGAFFLAIIFGPIVYFLFYGLSYKYRELKRRRKKYLMSVFVEE
ncbi:hypothetical protein CL619_02430 [archaeon]|nr:hypothetical protein [archaeon]|tara:strand:+ start:2528 stop:3031 length:504 start_codon:yes stop_codon:yes gene_type:complete